MVFRTGSGSALRVGAPRIGVAVLAVVLSFAMSLFGGFVAVDAAASLDVYFFDVDQGDSILFAGPDFTILVDAGRHDRADVVDHLHRAGVTELDLFVGTHPHADHIGQCAAVLENFPVKEVWLSGDVHTTLTFERCIDAILASDAGYHEPRAGETFAFGAARIDIVHPARLTGHLNNGSVGMKLTYGHVSFLLTGDAETAAEAAMVERGENLRADVLKLGHHGSRTSSTAPFIEAVAPRLAVYSAGTDNSYGHPHPEVLQRLEQQGIRVYGTDVHGTIRVTTDGDDLAVAPERDGGVPVGVPSAGAAPQTTGDKFFAPACEPEQVNVNDADAAALQRIIHIGPAMARRIIEARPFADMEDLLRVSGIGAARLADIKAQGVACVAP